MWIIMLQARGASAQDTARDRDSSEHGCLYHGPIGRRTLALQASQKTTATTELLFDEEERLYTRGGMGSSEAHKEGDGTATSYSDRIGHGSVDPRFLERDLCRGDRRRRNNDRVRSESQYRVSAHDDGVLYSPGTVGLVIRELRCGIDEREVERVRRAHRIRARPERGEDDRPAGHHGGIHRVGVRLKRRRGIKEHPPPTQVERTQVDRGRRAGPGNQRRDTKECKSFRCHSRKSPGTSSTDRCRESRRRRASILLRSRLPSTRTRDQTQAAGSKRKVPPNNRSCRRW